MKPKQPTPERDYLEIEDLEQEERSQQQEPREIIESRIDLHNEDDHQVPEQYIQVSNF